MSIIANQLKALLGAYIEAHGPTSLDLRKWDGVVARFEEGTATPVDRELVRRMAAVLFSQSTALDDTLGHAARRFGSVGDIPDFIQRASAIPVLEDLILFHTQEGERLASEGKQEEAWGHFHDAARIISQLIWEYARAQFKFKVADVLTEGGVESFSIKDRIGSLRGELFQLLEKLPPVMHSFLSSEPDQMLMAAWRSFLDGNDEEAQKELAKQFTKGQTNPVPLPFALALFETIELSLKLKKEEDPEARLEYQALLVSALDQTAGQYDEWMGRTHGEMSPQDFALLQGRAGNLFEQIIVGVIRQERLPKSPVRFKPRTLIPNPILQALIDYWEVRFDRGAALTSLTGMEDPLFMGLESLDRQELIPAVILQDARDFMTRLLARYVRGIPLQLFAHTPPEETKKKEDLEDQIFQTGLKLLQSKPSSEGLDMGKRIRRYQDQLTLTLAQFADLLNANMRFTDVLPEIEDDSEAVVSHFREYFPQPDPRLPALINMGIRAAHSSLPAAVVAKAIRRAVQMMASLYIAGDSFASAKKTFLKMAENGEGIIADVLGEAVTSVEEADAYRDAYLRLIAELPDHMDLIEQARAGRNRNYTVRTHGVEFQPDIQMAIKFSALVPISEWNAADPEGTSEEVKKRFRPILDAILESEKRGIKISITIDPEEYESRDMVHQIFKEVFMENKYRKMARVGIGLQAYLQDSGAVLEEMARWSRERGTSVAIRLIKGAYWDAENLATSQKGFDLPVFPEKWMSDVNFERLTDKLFDHADVLRAAFGSHNVRSLAYAIEQARARDKPMEIQMLYGMADDTKEDLVKMGLPVWVYSPMGKLLPGMAYLARRILENSSQNSFLLQRKSGKSPEELLKNPFTGHEGDWPYVPQKRKAKVPDLNALFENEPVTDFSRRDERMKIRKALARWRENKAHTYPLMINGKEVATDQQIVSINPSDPSQVVGTTAKAGAKEARLAVAAARAQVESWSGLGARKRALTLLKAAEIMRREKADLTALLMLESGKTVREADGDVAEAIDFLEYYAREALRLEEENSDLYFKAHGVTAVIAPWNFPLAILTGMTAAALAMGNTVVIKPASQTPVIGARLAEILRKAGLPPGVVNYLPGSGAALREAGVDAIAFTGSLDVGLDIYEKETPKGVKVIAELGGKNALIVDRDAHPDDVIKIVLESKFGYSGQKCSALDRLIIVGDKNHFRTMVDRLVKAAKDLHVGGVDNFGNYYGPLIDEEAYQRVVGLIADAAKTNKLLLDGREHMVRQAHHVQVGVHHVQVGVHHVQVGVHHVPPPGHPELVEGSHGYFVGPTILEVTDPNDPLFQEENFAPVLGVMRANTLEEAVTLAQNSKYGLTAGYIGRSPKNEKYVRDNFTEVGNLYINRKQTAAVVDRQPFGGVKLSGIGSKAGGRDYLLQFAEAEYKDPVRLENKSIFQLVAAQTIEKMMTGEVYQPQILGESNKIDFHPRGSGLIILDYYSDLGQIFGLLAAALFTGNDVHVVAAPNRSQDLLLLKNVWQKVRKEGFKGEVLGMNENELSERVSNPDCQWVAYHGRDKKSPGSAYKKSIAAAVKTSPGQRFVRSIVAPKDVMIEFGMVFQGMTLPRTVTINTARHGFDAKSAMTTIGVGAGSKPALIDPGFILAEEDEEASTPIPEKDRRARFAMASGIKAFGLAPSGRAAVSSLRNLATRSRL